MPNNFLFIFILALFLLNLCFYVWDKPFDMRYQKHVEKFLYNKNSEISQPKRSRIDSFNFLDYSNQDWEVKKQLHFRQRLKQINNMQQHFYDQGHFYFAHHWDPTWACDYEERVGNFGDGGKWVCDTRKLAAQRNESEECNVISVGSQNDFSFEIGIHEINPDCNIFVFDHTSNNQNAPNYVKFFEFGLGSVDQNRLLTLRQALEKTKLLNKTVDILKIDCEGCEFDIYHQFVSPEFQIMQILIEVHFRSAMETHRFFQEMTKRFVIFHKEPNLLPSSRGDCVEYGFLRLNVE